MRKLNTRTLRPAAGLLITPLLLVLGGCSGDVFNPAGDVAMQERDLILVATAFMLVIILPVMALTVVFARRYRKGAGAKYDPSFDHSTWLELVIWSCPLLIIICLGAITWSSTHLLDPFRPLDRIAPGQPVAAGTRPLDVQVVALDWKWLFIYPAQGIATVNELALPVGVPVRFSLTATDQMNTFYAPTLAGMIYTMPGMQSMLHAVLNRPVETWGYSGNYTGDGYSYMRFQLHGLDQAGFDNWVATVKSSQTSLDATRFLALARPSEREPVAHFGSVQQALFDRVVNRCVEPGKACIADLARHDQQQGAEAMNMPAGREGAAPAGEQPVPALEKSPAEVQPDQTINRPGAPSVETGLKPSGSTSM
jgi:cytochrome o ubiquinol oxidase subunit 2